MGTDSYEKATAMLLSGDKSYREIAKLTGIWPSQLTKMYTLLRATGGPLRKAGGKRSKLTLTERAIVSARAAGIPFDIVNLPLCCPVLGTPLTFTTPESSYAVAKGVLVSGRAAKAGKLYSSEELQKLAAFYKKE